MSVKMEQDTILSHNERIKALGTFCYGLGLAMITLSVLGPMIEGNSTKDRSAGAVAYWFVIGVVSICGQQLILTKLKRETRDVQ